MTFELVLTLGVILYTILLYIILYIYIYYYILSYTILFYLLFLSHLSSFLFSSLPSFSSVLFFPLLLIHSIRVGVYCWILISPRCLSPLPLLILSFLFSNPLPSLTISPLPSTHLFFSPSHSLPNILPHPPLPLPPIFILYVSVLTYPYLYYTLLPNI